MKKKTVTNQTEGDTMLDSTSQSYDMIVFCHLRWNFVYQRPQHIISRLSKNYRILVVEEPIHHDGRNGYELEIISNQLTILRPKVENVADIRHILENLEITSVDFAWFYSAAFVDLLPYLKVNTIIYDCMDELSQFKGASPILRSQEKLLIEEADVIFTGGKSLYEEKSKQASNVYCFPSSVDEDHFRKAEQDIEIPSDIIDIPSPIVGYIGVIDERIDLQLLQHTAQENTHISFVMIGPLAKIDDNDLPRAQNIHYLGMKTYNELPHYLRAFTIAMMPFALNESTEYISPTKTLEYMAANKAIISTPIKDVVRDYSDAVHIVSNSKEFGAAISEIIKSKSQDTQKYEFILSQTSWDATAEKMMAHIKEKV